MGRKVNWDRFAFNPNEHEASRPKGPLRSVDGPWTHIKRAPLVENRCPICPDGRLTTSKYRGWTVAKVATEGQEGVMWLEWCLRQGERYCTIRPALAQRVRALILAHAKGAP